MKIVKLGVAGLVTASMALSVTACGGEADDSAPRQTIGGRPTLPTVPPTSPAGSSGPMSSAPGSSGPSPSTPAGPPVLPAVGKTNTKAGAEAFAQWFVESMNYSGMHPEVKLPPVWLPSCKTCVAYQNTMDAMVAKREHYGADVMTVKSSVADPFSPGAADVKVVVTQYSVPVLDSTGQTVRSTDAADGALWPTVVWRGGSWNIEIMRGEQA